MRFHLKKAILLALAVAPVLVHAAPLKTHFPATGIESFLAANLDLASFTSSFGPKRTLDKRTFAAFGMAPTKAGDNVLEFDTPDWYYRIDIVARGDFNGDGIEDLHVCFHDTAKKATYKALKGLLVTRYSDDTPAIALSYPLDKCARNNGK